MAELSWPGGAKAGAAITFDLDGESVWLAMDPESAAHPAVLSQGMYGPKVGVKHLLALLREKQVAATFFVPGVNVERYPEVIELILEHGHEIGIHGYTHTRPTLLSAEAESDELDRAHQVLTDAGARVTGYRAPGWDPSVRTVEVLERKGLRYASQMLDDLAPYRHPGRSLIELPVQWMLDDWPHFGWHTGDSARNIKGTREVEEIWLEELDGIRAYGGCFVLTLHPQVSGRPSRLALLGRVLDAIHAAGDVWLGTCDEIAVHVDRVLD